MKFKGFNEDSFKFLTELGFNNNKSFFDANKQRYLDNVKAPLTALAEEIMPTMLKIDPDFNPRIPQVVSRIYRDARRTHGIDPYRNHAWLGFKHPQASVSDAFSMYFEIQPEGYGYGMGCYAPTAAVMRPIHERIMADPATFLSLARDPRLQRFFIEGNSYKKDHFPQADEALKPYLNRRSLSWCFFSEEVDRLMDGEAFLEELKTAMTDLAALYQYMSFSLEFSV